MSDGPPARAILIHDGGWHLIVYEGERVLAKIELRSENGWTLLRSLVEMLGRA